ncbi:MAG TPA: phosphoribosylformylglycinamidine cyclo-ligase [Actinomycetota bacterium]|nr:phosphoribosylformylglycinamidine cyclo-ligase [Actinomycetota bacterium]
MGTGAYRRAGVDLDAAARAVDLIRDLAAGASRPEVVQHVGGFAGLFRLGEGRLLAAATDGVGTKVDIARMAGRFDTVGIDLVAMCANDVVTTGAEPLFFLDYIATSNLDPRQVGELVAGVAEGCRRAGCALLGGETAEHPGLLPRGRFDLAGFCVGSVAEDDVLGPHRVREGDALVGVTSTGLHSNGFSLVRKALEDSGQPLDAAPPELGRSLADELLEPTAIYVPAVLEASRRGLLRSAAHITGGGLVENVPRALPEGLGAELDRGSWTAPPVFGFMAHLADVSDEDMVATFNIGLGMVLVTGQASEVVAICGDHGLRAVPVGTVTAGAGVRFR